MQKISRGSGFRGVLSYLLDHDSPEIVSGTISSSTLSMMTREFVALSQIRSDIKKPVWHNSLRLPVGEHLSSEKWAEVANDYMREIGLESAQWVAIMHNLEDGEHIHIVANRVMPDASIYLGKNENLKSTKIISDLEKKHGLTVTKGINADDVKPGGTRARKNEIEKSIRTGEPVIRLVLQNLLDQALTDRPDTRDFINRLESAGVRVQPNISNTGRMNGFSFELNNVSFSGSKLGKKYTWNQLKKAIHHKEEHNDYLIRIKHKNGDVSNEQRDNEERDRRVRRTIHDEEISSEKTTTSTSKLTESIESDVVKDQNTSRAREEARQTKSPAVELSSTNRKSSHEIYKSGFVYISSTIHSDTHPNINNYNGVKTMKHKKKSFEELKNLDHNISGNTLEAPVGDELVEPQKRYLKTLELAFTQSGNKYFYRDTNRLAFYETDRKVVGSSLFNIDGSLNKTAVKAMTQAAQIKFGNEFKSTGSDEFLRESWFAAAMIGCNDTGFLADSAALDELKFRMLEHKDRFGEDVQLHENIAKLLEQHERDMKNRISITESGITGGLFENTQQQGSSNELKSTVNISSLVDNYQKAKNKESEKNNQEKPSIKSLIDNYNKSQP